MAQKHVLEGRGEGRKRRANDGMLTEDSDAVVERDNNDIPVAGQDTPIDHVARPLHVGSSVDVDHHGLGTGVSYVCKSGHH